MSLELRRRIFEELDQLVLIDPHTHINPHNPASQHLADILGYHYYTELAHSTGVPRDAIEGPEVSQLEKVELLMSHLGPLDNTIQYSWFVEIAQKLLGFQGDRIDGSNWESVYALADDKMMADDWAEQVLKQSRVEALFLTNDFDDPLEGFDVQTYIPCLRTDDLVFKLSQDSVRQRLEQATNVAVQDASSLRLAIERLFRHFKSKGARAAAISLPPDFTPAPVSLNRANVALDAVLRNGDESFESHRRALGNFVFWTIAEMCDRYRMPFDLMIGVNRNVYPAGVHQGRDLYDSRVSLIQYRELFNAFPRVTFPVSVLASVTNQELTSFAWIFPNVVTHGHWWYSNVPAFIEHDLAARLEAVPRTKQIGYYSDAYKLEFVLPKFAMYKRTLAKMLAERFVVDRGWSEARAVELGQQVLRGNVESTFQFGEDPREFDMPAEMEHAPARAFSAPISAGLEEPTGWDATSAAGIAAATAGAGAMAGLSLGAMTGGFDRGPVLREATDDFVIQPSLDETPDVQLEAPPSAMPTTSESGFALDESDNLSGDALDLADLNLGAAAADDSAAAAMFADEPAAATPAESAPDDEEPLSLGVEAAEQDAMARDAEMVELAMTELDEAVPVAETPAEEPFTLDLVEEEPAASETKGEPKKETANPFGFDLPDPPKKKDDGGLNFDFLK